MNSSSSHLFFGAASVTAEAVVCFIQQQLCMQKGCGSCSVCRAIAAHSHHRLRWLAPEKNSYALAALEELMAECVYARLPEETLFCVITSADQMSLTAANSLLKTLEEPLPGYCFILTSAQRERMLPTIISRCHIHECSGVHGAAEHPVVALFDPGVSALCAEFDRVWEATPIPEHQTRDVLDQIIAKLAARSAEGQAGDRLLSYVQEGYGMLPVTGSAKYFWRALFLRKISID